MSSCRATNAKWSCIVCGAYDGNRLVHPLEPDFLAAAWKDASNRVQWAARGQHQPTAAELF